jgi:hypothetical protein
MSVQGRLGRDLTDPAIRGSASPGGTGIVLTPGAGMDAAGADDGSGTAAIGTQPDNTATIPMMTAAIEVRPSVERRTIPTYDRRTRAQTVP